MLVEPRRNQISSWTIAPKATFLVVTSGKPSRRSNRICRPKTLSASIFSPGRAEHGPRRLPACRGCGRRGGGRGIASCRERARTVPGRRPSRSMTLVLYAACRPSSGRSEESVPVIGCGIELGRRTLARGSGQAAVCGDRSGRDHDQLLFILLLEHAVVPGAGAQADQEGPLAGDEPLAVDAPAVDLGNLDRGG